MESQRSVFNINLVPDDWFVSYIKADVLSKNQNAKTKQQEENIKEVLNNLFPDFPIIVKNLQYKQNKNFWHFYFENTKWNPHESFYAHKIFTYLINQTLDNCQEVFESKDQNNNNIWHCLFQNINLKTEKKLLVFNQFSFITSSSIIFEKNNQNQTVLDYIMTINDMVKKEVLVSLAETLCSLAPFQEQDEIALVSFMNKNNLYEMIESLGLSPQVENYFYILKQRISLNQEIDIKLKESIRVTL